MGAKAAAAGLGTWVLTQVKIFINTHKKKAKVL